MPSPTRLLIETRLGRPLDQLVAEMQAQGLGWRRIAEVVGERTNVTVSHESIRTWIAADAEHAA